MWSRCWQALHLCFIFHLNRTKKRGGTRQNNSSTNVAKLYSQKMQELVGIYRLKYRLILKPCYKALQCPLVFQESNLEKTVTFRGPLILYLVSDSWMDLHGNEALSQNRQNTEETSQEDGQPQVWLAQRISCCA